MKQNRVTVQVVVIVGGGSAFLKSKQKLSPSPSEDSKLTLEEPSFEIVREADSLDFLEDGSLTDNKEADEKKLKHSVSLGESGFDKLTKSKRFASLQESLLSLKNEMDLSNNEAKSPNTSAPLGLRGILREKPSPPVKLWDVDPLLLTSKGDLFPGTSMCFLFVDFISCHKHLSFSFASVICDDKKFGMWIISSFAILLQLQIIML